MWITEWHVSSEGLVKSQWLCSKQLFSTKGCLRRSLYYFGLISRRKKKIELQHFMLCQEAADAIDLLRFYRIIFLSFVWAYKQKKSWCMFHCSYRLVTRMENQPRWALSGLKSRVGFSFELQMLAEQKKCIATAVVSCQLFQWSCLNEALMFRELDFRADLLLTQVKLWENLITQNTQQRESTFIYKQNSVQNLPRATFSHCVWSWTTTWALKGDKVNCLVSIHDHTITKCIFPPEEKTI